MDVRHAAGFVLFTEEQDGRRYLLLLNSRHSTWGFPKGHRDPGEDDADCARRELAEETGLTDITVIDGFAHVAEHRVRQRGREWRKIVTYFLARLESGDPAISDEHTEARWVRPAEAAETLQFDSLREVLAAAEARLSTNE